MKKEKQNTIGQGCKKEVKEGSVYHLMIGVRNFGAKSDQTMALLVGDTVIVGKTENVVLTDGVSKSFSDIYQAREKDSKKTKEGKLAKNITSTESGKNPRGMDAEGQDNEDFPKVKILTRHQKMQMQNNSSLADDRKQAEKILGHQSQLLKLKTQEMKERYNRGEFKLATLVQV